MIPATQGRFYLDDHTSSYTFSKNKTKKPCQQNISTFIQTQWEARNYSIGQRKRSSGRFPEGREGAPVFVQSDHTAVPNVTTNALCIEEVRRFLGTSQSVLDVVDKYNNKTNDSTSIIALFRPIAMRCHRMPNKWDKQRIYNRWSHRSMNWINQMMLVCWNSRNAFLVSPTVSSTTVLSLSYPSLRSETPWRRDIWKYSAQCRYLHQGADIPRIWAQIGEWALPNLSKQEIDG